MRLPNDNRIKMALKETGQDLSKWDNMPTEINGKKVNIKANKKWGVVLLGNSILVTTEYPINELKGIEIQNKEKTKGGKQ